MKFTIGAKRACCTSCNSKPSTCINAAGRLSDMTLGIECLTTDDAMRADELAKQLDAINRELPQHERLAQLIVVRERWEVDNGFITPSLKIKRNQVEKFYHDVVHALSAKVEKVVWA